MRPLGRTKRPNVMKCLRVRKKKGLSRRSDAPKSTNSKETPVSWKNGSQRVLKTGSRIWLTRRSGNKVSLNLNTNRPLSSMK